MRGGAGLYFGTFGTLNILIAVEANRLVLLVIQLIGDLEM